MLSTFNTNFQIQLQGQIDWKIKNFLDWAEVKEIGYSKESTVFKFNFPEVKKCYKFSLSLRPKGEPDKEETQDQVGIFINNINSETLGIKFTVSLIDKLGAEVETASDSMPSLKSNNGWGFSNFTTRSWLTAFPKLFLLDGCLHIRCKFTIFDVEVVRSVISPDLESPSHAHLQTMEKLLTDNTFSDFKIICDDQTFYCHKCIVAAKSDVLQQMLLSENWSENEEETLEIKDFDVETVRAMIHYIYTSHLPPFYNCSPRYSLSRKFCSLLALLS
jgi:hypothetical protein